MPTTRKTRTKKRQARPLKPQAKTLPSWIMPVAAVLLALTAIGMGWYESERNGAEPHTPAVVHDCGTVAIGDGSDAQLSSYGSEGTQVALSPASFAPVNSCFMGDVDAGTPVSIVFTNVKANTRTSYEYVYDGSSVTMTYTDTTPGQSLPPPQPCNASRQQGGILFACGLQTNQFFTEQTP